MPHFEQYRAPLRAGFSVIRECFGRKENNKDHLKLALKAVNDVFGPEGA